MNTGEVKWNLDITKSQDGPSNFVRCNEVSLYRGSLTYSLPLLTGVNKIIPYTEDFDIII